MPGVQLSTRDVIVCHYYISWLQHNSVQPATAVTTNDNDQDTGLDNARPVGAPANVG